MNGDVFANLYVTLESKVRHFLPLVVIDNKDMLDKHTEISLEPFACSSLDKERFEGIYFEVSDPLRGDSYKVVVTNQPGYGGGSLFVGVKCVGDNERTEIDTANRYYAFVPDYLMRNDNQRAKKKIVDNKKIMEITVEAIGKCLLGSRRRVYGE